METRGSELKDFEGHEHEWFQEVSPLKWKMSIPPGTKLLISVFGLR